MAILSIHNDRIRRRLGLGLGSHVITLAYADIADADTVTIDGVILTCITGSAVVEQASFKKETNANTTAQNLDDLIGAIFTTPSGVTVSVSGGVVTVTGALQIVTSNSDGFAISAASSADRPPYTSDIAQWIEDIQNIMVSLLDDEVLISGNPGCAEVFTLAGDGSATELALPSTAPKLLRAKSVIAKIASDSAFYPLVRISINDMYHVRNGSHHKFKVKPGDGAQKYYAIHDEQMYFSAAPVNSANVSIYGIKQPQIVASVECDLPDHVQPLMEEGVLVIARSQSQRYDQASAEMQAWASLIQAVNDTFRRSKAETEKN